MDVCEYCTAFYKLGIYIWVDEERREEEGSGERNRTACDSKKLTLK